MSGSGSITSNAYILPYSTANPYSFAIPFPSITTTDPVYNDAIFDLNLKQTCDHVLSSGRYTLNTCPRCLGTGYYYDLKFNEVWSCFT